MYLHNLINSLIVCIYRETETREKFQHRFCYTLSFFIEVEYTSHKRLSFKPLKCNIK